MKKIVLLIPNLGYGGAQKVFHDHAKILAEKYEVVEVVFNMDERPAFESSNQIISLGVPAGRNVLDKIYRFIQRVYRFRKIIKRENCDLSISHLEGADYVNILAGGRGKKVLVIHGSKLFDQNISNWLGLLRKKILIPFLYSKADKIVTVSEGVKSELIDSFNLNSKNIITIYNFFFLHHLEEQAKIELPKEVRQYLKGKVLVTSGRLVNQKNHEALIHMVAHLKRKSNFKITLILLGSGILLSDLKHICESHSLKYVEFNEQETDGFDVVFMGYQANPLAFYKYAHLFLFPSAWEGFPMALGEAMHSKIPVVSADCPTGPLELIEPEWKVKFFHKKYPYWGENGVLLPVPDSKQSETIKLWVNTIMELIDNDEKRSQMAQKAQKRMKALDVKIVKEEWFMLINSLLQ